MSTSQHYLVTGATGFAGKNLCKALAVRGHQITGLDRIDSKAKGYCDHWITGDLLNLENLKAALKDTTFSGVFHLAGQPSVWRSLKDPPGTYLVNCQGTIHLMEALQAKSAFDRFLFVSSSEVYGTMGDIQACHEDQPQNPVNPYGMSKCLAEKLVRFYQPTAVIARPFAHTGPGQSHDFAIASFCYQIKSMQKGEIPPKLQTGNLKVRRNVLDVQDVIDGYLLLMNQGQAGETYNIAGNTTHSLEEVIHQLRTLSGIRFTVETDTQRTRDHDIPNIPDIPCTPLRKLGWCPTISLSETLTNMLRDAS